LVLDGLLISRYADVDCGSLVHDSPQCRQHRITSCTKNNCFMYRH
jgi:hypothetical protein